MNILQTIIVAVLTTGSTIFFVIEYYDNIKNIIADILSCIAATLGWFKSKSTQVSVEANCQHNINQLNSIVPELDLPRVSLQWVNKDEDGKVILNPGEAIVLLRYNRDNSQNILNTISIYVKNTLLLTSKPYMDEGVKKAIDFSVIRSFIKSDETRNFLIPQLLQNNKDDISNYSGTYDKVSKIEKEGLFSRILLREYSCWGNKIASEIPNKEHEKESLKLLDFVYNIASRGPDEFTPLKCISNNVKVAVLLVAKSSTYDEQGTKPYLRRIKEGFACGISTFYLLARNEKIEILQEVYEELMESGNFELQNGPKIYKNELGENTICYCIEVKKNSDIVATYNDVEKAIADGTNIEISITDVFSSGIRGDYNGMMVWIPQEEISTISDIRLKKYYSAGMTIQVRPLSIDGGEIQATLISTPSEPKSLINNKFEINSQVIAIVELAEDDFVRFIVKDTNQQAIAFRKDLTYSRFGYLHHLFPLGAEISCVIKNIDYVSNELILRRSDLKNPWESVPYKIEETLECTVCNIKETFCETELPGDYYAILPYSELTWVDSKIDDCKKGIKRNKVLTVRIKSIDAEKRIIVLTQRNNISDYQRYYDLIGKDNYNAQCVIKDITSYGVNGIVNKELRVFIPMSECHIGDSSLDYKIGKSYMVHIIEVSADKRSLIGSFKPFITPPLQAFSEKYKIGDVLSGLTMSGQSNYGVSFIIRYSRNKEIRAFLKNSEVSESCFVSNLNKYFENGYTCPLCIKSIDLEKNYVTLSMKDVFAKNKKNIEKIDWGEIVYGKVIGYKQGKYVAIVEKLWIDVILESDRHIEIGEKVKMIKASTSVFGEASL